jgi:energy-coupling factor transport system permease protein
MGGLFEYKDGSTYLHRMHPLTKLFLSLLLCAVCFVSNSVIFVLCIIAFNFAVALSAGAGRDAFRIASSLGKLSLVIFITQVLFVRQGQPLFAAGPLVVTDAGVLFSLLFVERLIAISLPLVILLSVTRPEDISNTLVCSLRLPVQYAFTITTALRFIPLLQAEMTNIMESQMSRGVDFDTKNFLKKIKLVLPLCVPLLVSSVRKIESTAIAADLRGFRLRNRRSIRKVYAYSISDAAAWCAGVGLLAIAVWQRVGG